MSANFNSQKMAGNLTFVTDRGGGGGQKCKLKQETKKRHKLQLYYAILCAIEEDTTVNKVARPTRIQHYSRLSYDKMMNHFIKLEEKGMMQRTNNGLVSITNKGREFTKQYDEMMNLVESAGL
jgi:predicted transcriptional regulator